MTQTWICLMISLVTAKNLLQRRDLVMARRRMSRLPIEYHDEPPPPAGPPVLLGLLDNLQTRIER